MDKKILNQMPDDQRQGVQKLGARKAMKLAKIMRDLYNGLCGRCRSVMLKSKGQADIKDYCKRCKPLAEKTHKSVGGLTK